VLESSGIKAGMENAKRQLTGSLKPSERITRGRHSKGGAKKGEVMPRAAWLATGQTKDTNTSLVKEEEANTVWKASSQFMTYNNNH
jgi:hypothetical protein